VKKNLLAKVEQKLDQGQIHEARELCIKLCNKNKKAAEAWSLLGIINGQLGSFDEAEKCFQKFVELQPRLAEGYFNLAKTQTTLQRLQQAEKNYQQAIKLKPSFAQAYNNLGTLQAGLNKAVEAEQNLRQALSIQPDTPNTYRNLGILMQHQGRIEEAEQAYHQAITLQPNFVGALEDLANLLLQLQRHEDAESCLLKAIQAQPANANSLTKLGKIYFLRQEYSKASEYFNQALNHNPNHVEAHIDLAAIKEKTGELDSALEHYRKALTLAPDNMRAHNNLSIILCLMGAHQDALTAANTALRLNPSSPEAYNNQANALYRLGRLEEAATALKQALHYRPDDAESHSNLARVLLLQGKTKQAFASHKRTIELQPNLNGAHSALLYAMNYSLEFSAEEISNAHRNWAEKLESSGKQTTTFSNSPEPERRLHIGYVSPDFRGHSVAFFLEPILKNHNQNTFEIFCYSDTFNTDQTTERMQGLSNHWRHICGLSDSEVAQIISDDQIDILIDLAGHTANNRLTMFATQSAPVQASYLGYPNTTGLQTMHYLITDEHCDPEPEFDQYYSEKLCRLPNAFFCYQPPANSPAVTAPPVLKNGYISFASYNNLAKIGEKVVALWSQVLHAVPGSRLLFQCLSLNDPATRNRFEQLFKANGIDIKRIQFCASESFDSYLAGHAEVDIILDSFPWNGHTVSCHALWMGVPVITLAGDRHASRMGKSILTNLELNECVADSETEFVAAATALANNQQRLTDLRQQLRPRMQRSNLCDGQSFTLNLEEKYRHMWQQWCKNNN